MPYTSPSATGTHRTRKLLSAGLVVGSLLLAACGSDSDEAEPSSDAAAAPATEAPVGTDAAPSTDEVLRVGAIPDQDVDILNRTYALVSNYLSSELGVTVEYVPVTEYSAAVGQLRTGDLDLVWYGALTGVQARIEAPGSVVVAQRDIDPTFQSVYIANVDAGIGEITDVAGLAALAGTRFTYGSESSTSGRLMPQFFLEEAGVMPEDFDGEPGFSGSHDKTIDLVEAGTFQTGALSKSVWESRSADGSFDAAKVVKLFDTPEYANYHWVAGPTVAERFGPDFVDEIQAALVGLDADDENGQEILDLFGAGSFIPTEASNYDGVEAIGRTLGLVND